MPSFYIPEQGISSQGGEKVAIGNELPVGRNEQRERQIGQNVEAVAQQPQQPVVSSLPAPVAVDDTTQIVTPSTNATPLVAADDDLIEKEWVDKAKQVISETKDDPYRREQEVKKLQNEYILKRYSHKIGSANE